MTTGCNIFCDKTPMPGNARDEMDEVTRVRQVTTSPGGAMVPDRIQPEGMNVSNVTRPRRGHDY